MKNHFTSMVLLLIIALGFGCTDPIKINLKAGAAQLAVDGTITDQTNIRTVALPDTIRLTNTNGFLDGPSPIIANATVIVTDNAGNVDTLQYAEDGKYITHINKITGVIGRTYTLTILANGEEYQASDILKRVTMIDSLVTDYRSESNYGRAPGYFVNLYANDLKGIGDFYRFEVYKNNQLYNRPTDLSVCADAGGGVNTPIDSVRFIEPVRESLNPPTGVNDPGGGGDEAPYVPGDLVTAEILSISEATYNFYTALETQITNDGLFASPAANVPTNIINTNPKSTNTAVGWFSASAISSKSVIIQKKQ